MQTIWELDYYSRPLLDEQNKKRWEVLICESSQTIDRDPASLFRFSKFCSSTEVNSVWLKSALEEAIAQAPNPPDRIRFFRQAMNNMITKACTDMGLSAQLSRRTVALNQWLQQRFRDEYPAMEGYQPGSNPSVSFPKTPPQRLPDALRGDKWNFVTLEANAFSDMKEWSIDFGEAFAIELAGLPPDAPIPGLLIYSSRAVPLAAWMSGLELACVSVGEEPAPGLLLETGINDRWILAALPNADLQAEAERFEATKQQSNGVHFIAIQTNPNVETFAGFWLLQAADLS